MKGQHEGRGQMWNENQTTGAVRASEFAFLTTQAPLPQTVIVDLGAFSLIWNRDLNLWLKCRITY